MSRRDASLAFERHATSKLQSDQQLGAIRTMGFRGQPSDLLDAETNLRYAVRYLRGAWLLADGSHDRAVMWYARGYYYEAKRRGMLRETGLRT